MKKLLLILLLIPLMSFGQIEKDVSKVTKSKEPLYLIDGIEVPSTNKKLEEFLKGINNNEIERVDVLKDSSAIALYGLKGVNGVVLITTKKLITKLSRLNLRNIFL
jgi:TonB-dependent SusC/RagA subfamily outer membrane receptor